MNALLNPVNWVNSTLNNKELQSAVCDWPKQTGLSPRSCSSNVSPDFVYFIFIASWWILTNVWSFQYFVWGNIAGDIHIALVELIVPEQIRRDSNLVRRLSSNYLQWTVWKYSSVDVCLNSERDEGCCENASCCICQEMGLPRGAWPVPGTNSPLTHPVRTGGGHRVDRQSQRLRSLPGSWPGGTAQRLLGIQDFLSMRMDACLF